MADQDITDLAEMTDPAANDLLHVIDVSAAAHPQDRKMTLTTLMNDADLAASEAQRGPVELATTAEAQAGTDTARAVTPAGVKAYHQQPITIGVSGVTEGDVTLASLASEDWHIALGQQASYGHNDELMFVGYNKSGINAFDDNSKQSIYMVFESDYYTSAVEHVSEWYVEFRGADGTLRRPFQTSAYINTNTVNNFITGRTDFYRDTDGNQNLYIDNSGNISLTNSNFIAMETNSVTFFKQKNAAGSGYIGIYLNAGNQWDFGAGFTMWGDIYFNHSTNHGPILIDRATAALRRIICTNGVLSTEAV